MKKATFLVVAAFTLPAVAPWPAEARVVRFVVEQTRIVAGGQGFGDVGPYRLSTAPSISRSTLATR